MRKTRRVAISICGFTFFGREAIRGMLRYCMDKADWEVHYEGATEEMAITRIKSALTEWRAEGIIMQDCRPELEEIIRKRGVPAIFIGGLGKAPISSVSPDNVAVGRLVAQYFRQRHLVNFAYFGVRGEPYSQARLQGFQEELAKEGYTASVYDLQFMSDPKRDWMADYAGLAQWLRSLPKPVGVMACNDYNGRDVIWTCRRHELRVPDDVAVVGVDNDPVECAMSPVPLSSVILPVDKIGYDAALMLDTLMADRKRHCEPILLAPQDIVTRQSSDVFAVADSQVADAMRFIRNHASEPITVTDILRAVPISRRALERRCLRAFGVTLRYQILRAHVDKAKRLLSETDLKMMSVSQRSGFSRYQVFSKLFKQITGVLPSEYRLRCGRPLQAADTNADED